MLECCGSKLVKRDSTVNTNISRSTYHGTSTLVTDMRGKFKQHLDGWDDVLRIESVMISAFQVWRSIANPAISLWQSQCFPYQRIFASTHTLARWSPGYIPVDRTSGELYSFYWAGTLLPSYVDSKRLCLPSGDVPQVISH